MPHSSQFLPECVDEQIDQLSRLPESETVNGQFINDLHITSKEYIERRDRVWARIEAQVRNRYGTEQMGILPNGLPGSNFAGRQQNAPQRLFSFSRLHSRRKPLELIAAVLVAALIVSSMLWLVAATHPPKGGTIVASQTSASQTSSKPVISGKGILYPEHKQDIQYPIDITVKAVDVEPGQTVKTGQVLMQIDTGRIIEQIQLAQTRVQSLEAQVNADTVSNSSHVTADKQQLTLAQSQLQQLQQQLTTIQGHNITASINGVVTQVNVDTGQTVSAKTVLLTIMDESVLVVQAKVPLTFMGQVHAGQFATVTTPSQPGLSVRGNVTGITPAVDPKTQTFEAWVSIPNPTQQLLAGMDVEVQFQVK